MDRITPNVSESSNCFFGEIGGIEPEVTLVIKGGSTWIQGCDWRNLVRHIRTATGEGEGITRQRPKSSIKDVERETGLEGGNAGDLPAAKHAVR